MRCSKGESFAGHLLGNPFHEEAGSLHDELNTTGQYEDQEDDEIVVDEDSEESSPNEEGTKYHREVDDDENRQERLYREVESGLKEHRIDHDGSDEGVDEGVYEGSDEGSHRDSYKGSGRSSDVGRIKSRDEAIENQTHQEQSEGGIPPSQQEEANEESATDQREDRNDGDDESSTEANDNVDDSLDDGQNVKSGEHGKQDNISRSWYALVQDYSQRALSRPEDILIALGALAQEFHILHQNILGSYAAGLWTEKLKEGLLWHLSYPRHPDRESFIPPKKTATEYRAPSWSWASSEQPVAFRIQREPHIVLDQEIPDEPTWYIEIVDSSVTPRGERNPFGAVQTAHVDVKGLLTPIRRVSRSSGHKSDRCAVDDVALVKADRTSDYNGTDLFAPDSIEALEKIDSSCHWLLVYDATRGRARGLIIRKIASGQYQRLGFAEFSVNASDVRGEQCVIRLV